MSYNQLKQLRIFIFLLLSSLKIGKERLKIIRDLTEKYFQLLRNCKFFKLLTLVKQIKNFRFKGGGNFSYYSLT